MQFDSLLKYGEFDTWLSKLVMNTMETNDSNELLLDVIIAALRGYVETNGKGLDNDSEEARKSGTINFSYLLGQSIRQWQIPEENWHTSVAAMDVWRLLVDEKYNGRIIKDNKGKICGYKEKLPEPTSIKIPRFIGTTKDFSKITVDDVDSNNTKQYVFNNIFIAEHTIPVGEIMEALRLCYEAYSNNHGRLKADVRRILNKMHITQMLKIEDRRIKECQNRIALVKGNKELYEYIIDTESDKLFHDVIDKCYDTQIYDATDLTLSSKVETLKSESWAGALALDKPYKIEIIPNNPKLKI